MSPVPLIVLGLLSYCTGCPSSTVELTAQEYPQFLTSPNHPGFYGSRLSCSWKITANLSYSDVVLEFLVYNSTLEPATGCWRDSVEVIDGANSFQRPLESWCGTSYPQSTFISSGPVALVLFSTDFERNDYPGFFLGYWLIKTPLLLVYASEWTTINYVLFGASGTIILSLLACLATIYIIHRLRYLRLQRAKEKED